MRRLISGQSMVEYTVVTAALVLALFYASTAECDGYDSCVSKLLTVMHDNYDGYSASITAVQKYPDPNLATPVVSTTTNNQNSLPTTDDGGQTTGTGGLPAPPALNEVQVLTDADTNQLLGTIQTDGSVVDQSGNIIGTYDAVSGLLNTGGGVIAANASQQVFDQNGVRLYPRAIVDCSATNTVYGWAYIDTETGNTFNTLNLNQIDIEDYCLAISYAIRSDGQPYPGRIVSGFYYQNTLTIRVNQRAQQADGELIFLSDSNSCLVARSGWDQDQSSLSSAEAEALIRLEQNFIGELDRGEYFAQTRLLNCPSAKVF